MPRKKTIQPDPLYEIPLPNGDAIEVRDDSCQEIGRGLHKVHTFENKRDAVLENVVDDYFKPGKSSADSWVFREDLTDAEDYLATATRFARWMELHGYAGTEGKDDSALRKKLYPEILIHVKSLKNALAAP